MKKHFISLLALCAFLLTGCEFVTLSINSNGQNNSDSTSSNQTSDSTMPTTGSTKIEIYATNDIHGQIMEESGRAGILEFATFMKQRSDEKNTLLIDQGDTWQGSIYSNYNHGELMTDMFNYIKYDARTIGNHDFDWGADYIAKNTAKTYDGYATPVLAGNIYDFNFSTKKVGTTQQSNLGRKSVTYTLDNGVKVGILGCIGKGQITSISSNFTTNIAFTDHIKFIKDEATHLRNDEKCNVVIASIHAGQEDVLGNELNKYVDLVLCGHTHREESESEEGLYYVQNSGYAQGISRITLTYDYAKKDITRTTINRIAGYDINNNVSVIDPAVQNIYTSYVDACQTAAQEVLATNLTGYWNMSENVENLMAKAIFDETVKEGYDVCLSYVNVARHDLKTSPWTYADLYQSFPFDNTVYIADIKGSEFLYEIAHYNYIYRNPAFTTNKIDPNGTYRIAVLDYLYFHTNESRYYDYFNTTGGSSTITLTKNYREILRDWLKDNGYNSGTELNANNYSSDLWQHDRTVFN